MARRGVSTRMQRSAARTVDERRRPEIRPSSPKKLPVPSSTGAPPVSDSAPSICTWPRTMLKKELE